MSECFNTQNIPVVTAFVSKLRTLTIDWIGLKPLTELFHSAVVSLYRVDSILTSQRHQPLQFLGAAFRHA